MRYRSEIDGLRAVAVVPVILFHSGLPAFSGGFVGVDVFFVISGYLITTILVTAWRSGTFSLIDFYERRARRILPALFLVMACCIPFAVLWMPTRPLEDFARSLLFTSFFASNVHFLEKAGGYFSVRSELQPLLHTWSLAVEEQFYLIFPLLLGFLMKWRLWRVFGVLTVMAVLSLGLSEWGSRNYADQNFFFTLSRFWELLAGALCALYLLDRPVKDAGWIATVGLLMIVGAVFVYGPATPFPSLYALLPVLGTVAVILFTTPRSAVGRLLSWAPMVGIGLISYSAYLWHQPLFAFARIRSLEAPGMPVMLALAVVAFGLAYLSWRFVEQPFRRPGPGVLRGRGVLLSASGVCIAGFVAFGALGMQTKGLPQRLHVSAVPSVGAALSTLTVQPTYQDCSLRLLSTEPEHLSCAAFAPDSVSRTIAVIGDSHAESLLPAFQTLAETLPARIVIGTQSACPPLLGVYTTRSKRSVVRCHVYMQSLADRLRDEGVSAVFLVAKWSVYTGPGLHPGNPRLWLRRSLEDARSDRETSRAVFEEGLTRTVAFFRDAGIPVFLVQQVPETHLPPDELLEKLVLVRHGPEDTERLIEASFVSIDEVVAAHRYVNDVLARHAASDVHVISLNAPFVVGERYSWFSGAHSLYRDTSHLSLDGAQFLRDHLQQQAKDLLARGLSH